MSFDDLATVLWELALSATFTLTTLAWQAAHHRRALEDSSERLRRVEDALEEARDALPLTRTIEEHGSDRPESPYRQPPAILPPDEPWPAPPSATWTMHIYARCPACEGGTTIGLSGNVVAMRDTTLRMWTALHESLKEATCPGCGTVGLAFDAPAPPPARSRSSPA